MPNPRVANVSRLLHRTSQYTQAQSRYLQGDMVKRIRDPDVNITTSKVDFKPQHTAKTNQTWKYQGGQILRAPSLLLNGTKYEDPKNPGQPRRKNESNFFITINCNKAPSGEDAERGVKQMQQMLNTLADERVLARYIKFGPVGPEYRDDKYVDVVTAVDWKAAVETGDIKNRLHSHIWLTLTHYSQVQINPQMLQFEASNAFNKGLALGSNLRVTKKMYVHVKLLPQSDWTNIMKQYIHKGMSSIP